MGNEGMKLQVETTGQGGEKAGAPQGQPDQAGTAAGQTQPGGGQSGKPQPPAQEYDFRTLELPADLEIVEVPEDATPDAAGQLVAAFQAQGQMFQQMMERMTQGFQTLGQALRRPANAPAEAGDDADEPELPGTAGPAQQGQQLVGVLKQMHRKMTQLEQANATMRDELAGRLRDMELGLRTETVQKDIGSSMAGVLKHLGLKELPGFTPNEVARLKHHFGPRVTMEQAATMAANNALKALKASGFVQQIERKPKAPEIPGARDVRGRPTWTPPKLPESRDESLGQLEEAINAMGILDEIGGGG